MKHVLVARLIRRLGWGVVVIVGVATLSFVVAQILPGDPARMMLGPHASAADVAHAREIYGLDRPLPVQYARYWGRLLHRAPAPANATQERAQHRSCAVLGAGMHLDLGYSLLYRKPVVELLAAKIPRSAELALGAVLVQLAPGIALGVLAAGAARHGLG